MRDEGSIKRLNFKVGIKLLGLTLCLVCVFLAKMSEAVVQFIPRVNNSGEILKNDAGDVIASEDYVIFGKFDHRIGMDDGAKEVQVTPILWRVMSADNTVGSQSRVILLTHHLLESMAYQNQYEDRGFGEDPQYVRPGTTIAMNTWFGSEVQTWLSSSGTETIYRWNGSNAAPYSVRGFLHSDYFNAAEVGALLPYPDGTGSKMTLPSFWTTADMSLGFDWYEWPYSGEMFLWFGENDADSSFNYGPNSLARRASFKGALFIYDNDNQGSFYWSRSPIPGASDTAGTTIGDGTLYNEGVLGTAMAVRPVGLLNLNALLFKAASADFRSVSLPSGNAGSPSNPYIVVLPGTVPTGVPDGWLVTYTLADSVPVNAQINGKVLTLEWSTAISPAVKNWPASHDFTLSTGEHPVGIADDAFNPKRLTLTFATGVRYRDSVSLSYNLNMDAISFDSTGISAKLVNSFTNKALENKTPSGGGEPPVDPPSPSPVPLSDVLATLSAALAPHRVSILDPFNCSIGTLISKTQNVLEFSKKLAPTTPLQDYKELLPSFTSAVTLGSGTVGDVLALCWVIDTRALAGFENWKSLNDNERILHLNELNIIFAYEYADKTWTRLIGAECFLSWEEALKLGIVVFTDTDIQLNYAVTDALGKPWICDGFLIVPDGTKDNKIIDPVWLMQKKATIIPNQLSFSREKVELEVGESAAVTAFFSPAEATERELLWSVSRADTVRVEKSSEADVYRITGTAEGTVQLRATVSAEERVQAAIEVAVIAKEEKQHGSSGGCNAGASIVILAAWGLLRVISSVRAKKQRY